MMNRNQFCLILVLALAGGMIGGIGSDLLFSGSSVWAQKGDQTPRVLRAQRFELVDQMGHTRAQFGLGPPMEDEIVGAMLQEILPEKSPDKNATARLVLLDGGGKVSALLNTRGFYLFDPGRDHLPRILLALRPDGTPRLSLHGNMFKVELRRNTGGIAGLAISDGAGRIRAGLGITPDGMPGLALSGPDGRIRIGLGVFLPQRPGLFLYDREGRGRTVLGLTEAGDPALALYDRKLRERALLSMGPDRGDPSLAFYDPPDRLVALLGSSELEGIHQTLIPARPTASLLLLDDQEKVHWRAP